MKVFAMWYGGTNYAMFDRHEKSDIEDFESIDHAIQEFEGRAKFQMPYYPCVDELTEMHVFKENPFGLDDYEAEWVLRIDHNGETQIEGVDAWAE